MTQRRKDDRQRATRRRAAIDATPAKPLAKAADGKKTISVKVAGAKTTGRAAARSNAPAKAKPRARSRVKPPSARGANAERAPAGAERSDAATPFPALDRLHERHRGVTAETGATFDQAARVCLSRHHSPPQDFEVTDGERRTSRTLAWRPSSQRENAAWKNTDDATRDGAYAIALAAVELERGLYAVSRAETKTGADFYLGSGPNAEDDDLEAASRLEVSGTDEGSLTARFAQKVKQAQVGDSSLPALVCVVGFRAVKVVMDGVDSR